VTGERSRRLTRVIGWLLTPVVAWAASFLGGWIGALLGRRLAAPGGALAWLGAGAVLGALLGATGWVLLLRRWTAPERQAGGQGGEP
jgi:hypothetical protein